MDLRFSVNNSNRAHSHSFVRCRHAAHRFRSPFRVPDFQVFFVALGTMAVRDSLKLVICETLSVSPKALWLRSPVADSDADP